MNTENTALDLLGRLLAAENIQIVRQRCATPSFGIKDRTLILPLWENISHVQETLLIGHETGHALFTTEKYVNNAFDKTRPKFRHYLNVCEDARIERLMKEKFPGLRRDFHLGYTEFHAADFFKLSGRDTSKLNLIDRINMHFKLGRQINLKFNAVEEGFLNVLTEVVTEDDAVEIAQAIYDYAKANAPKPKPEEKRKDKPLPPPKDEDDEQIPEEEEEDEGEDDESEEGEEENESSEPSDEESEEEDESEEDEVQADKSADYLDSETQDNFDESLGHTAATLGSKIYNIKTKLAQSVKLIPVSEILDDFRKLEKRQSEGYRKFREINSKLVSHMVQTFEMKKAAIKLRRTAVGESGVLNMSKIHKYKIATEIFKQYKIEVNETSHGFIMLLDYSGSMLYDFKNVMAQIITLVSFCTAVDIKFEVLAFSDRPQLYTMADGIAATEVSRNIFAKRKDNELFMYNSDKISMLQFYKSGMKRIDMDLISVVLYDNLAILKSQTNDKIKQKYKMGTTPLIEALLFVNAYLTEFKAKYNVQKTTLIILTDGGATDTEVVANYNEDINLYAFKIFLNSTITNRFYPISLGSNHQDNRNELQKKLITVIRNDHPDVKIIGFFIAPESLRSLTAALRYYKQKEQYWDRFKSEVKVVKSQLKKQGYASYNLPGYHQFFILPQEGPGYSEVFDRVSRTMTAAQMAKAASGNSLKTKASRFVANTFITEIA